METYYVRPVNGSDANAGTSFASAFATTQQAASIAIDGDSVILCAEAVEMVSSPIVFPTTGSAGSGITFSGADALGVTGSERYVLRAGQAITSVIVVPATTDCIVLTDIDLDGNGLATHGMDGSADRGERWTMRRCRVHHAIQHGVWHQGNAWAFYDCEIDSNGGNGTHATSSRGHQTVIDCDIHHNGGRGLIFGSGGGCHNTAVWSNALDGIGSIRDALRVDHCTVWGNGGHGITMLDSRDIYGFGEVYNSSFVSNGGFGINTLGNGFTRARGLVDQNHTHGNASGPSDIALPGEVVAGDPLFVAPITGDFTPGAGSPLIGAGRIGRAIGAKEPAAGGSNPTARKFRGEVLI